METAIIEMIKWVGGIATGAAIGGVVATYVSIRILEGKSRRLSNRFFMEIRRNPEVQEWVYRFDRLFRKLEKMVGI